MAHNDRLNRQRDGPPTDVISRQIGRSQVPDNAQDETRVSAVGLFRASTRPLKCGNVVWVGPIAKSRASPQDGRHGRGELNRLIEMLRKYATAVNDLATRQQAAVSLKRTHLSPFLVLNLSNGASGLPASENEQEKRTQQSQK
jgi:hypothetical protein